MKRGRKPQSQDRVYQTTWAVLEELTTIDGMPFDDWLMKLRPEDVEKLRRPPGKKRRLSLDTWKRATEGWAMFQREGQETFEAWATQQTEKLYKYKKLQMQELLELVEQRLGHTKKRNHSPKGVFLKYVQEAKDLFLIRWTLSWEETPPALRHQNQPGTPRDPGTFWQRCEDSINRTGIDIVF